MHVRAWAPVLTLPNSQALFCASVSKAVAILGFLAQAVRRIISLNSVGHVCAWGWSTTGEPRGGVILSSEQGLLGSYKLSTELQTRNRWVINSSMWASSVLPLSSVGLLCKVDMEASLQRDPKCMQVREAGALTSTATYILGGGDTQIRIFLPC